MALKLDVTDTTLYSDRSICWLRLFVSEDALLDAEACISMRPKWAKDYYLQGMAFLLLEDHVGAAKALLNALKAGSGERRQQRSSPRSSLRAAMHRKVEKMLLGASMMMVVL